MFMCSGAWVNVAGSRGIARCDFGPLAKNYLTTACPPRRDECDGDEGGTKRMARGETRQNDFVNRSDPLSIPTHEALDETERINRLSEGINATSGIVGAGAGALSRVQSFARPKVIHPPVDELYNAETHQLKVLQDRCFAPETLIATPSGPRPIGEMRRGDTVLAYDHRTGNWCERAVAKFHENIYEGPLVTITTDSGPIRTTVYHPFWVLSGRDLDERSTPRELAEDEDQGFSL